VVPVMSNGSGGRAEKKENLATGGDNQIGDATNASGKNRKTGFGKGNGEKNGRKSTKKGARRGSRMGEKNGMLTLAKEDSVSTGAKLLGWGR